jgi:methyl-accepting chemotaxis protein
MRWFYNLKVRNKFFAGFGLLTTIVVSVALVGYQGLHVMNSYLVSLHDEHFSVAISVADTATNLNAVRATLLGMMAAKDRGDQEKLHATIQQLTKQIDGSFERLRGRGLSDELRTKLTKVQETWQAFRDTRDRELIPAIYDGRLDDARKLATGVQAERFAVFSSGATQLIKEAQEKALHFKEEGGKRYAFSVAVFIALSTLAGFVGVGLAVLYTRFTAVPLGHAVKVLVAVAAGDFTRKLVFDSKDEVGQMATALNQAVDEMRQALQQVRGAATNAAEAARQLSAASDMLSSGAQEQASALEETAASLEEITGTVKQNADNARQANQLAVGSRDTAEKGGEVVTEAVDAMGEINKSSKRIADIITTIDEIAFQTNLLALNAAVEAARAGEQGRGFAVVAAEVRSLAQRSATAAKEIKGLIQDSVQKVEDVSDLVNKSGQTLQEIVSSVKRVTDIIGEIAAASQEQSSGIDQVNKAVTQMDQVVQSNAAQTEELSSTAQSLSVQAQQLQDLVGKFKLGQDGGASGQAIMASATGAPRPKNASKTPAKSPPSASAIATHIDLDRIKMPASHASSNGDSRFEEF